MTPMQNDKRMRSRLISSMLYIFLIVSFLESATTLLHANTLRPPSVPLIVSDPYFSIWSPGSRLTETDTTHWTGMSQSLASLIRIDGRTYRLMGTRPTDVPALPQIDLEVTPTRSIYSFEGEGIRLTLTFMTPMLPSDLDVFSRPVTYLTWAVNSIDSKKHSVSLYYDSTAELVVNEPDEIVVWSREKVDNLYVEKFGTQAQPILAKSGDDLRINWGYLYVAAIDVEGVSETVTEASRAQQEFAQSGAVTDSYDTRMPRPVDDHMPAVAITFSIFAVGAVPIERHILLAYDEIYSVELLHRRLRPYWRRNGDQPEDLLRKAAAEYSSLEKRCKSFDELVQQDLTKVGGAKYASLGALAYRAALAANGLAADVDGRPLFFTKENFSDGSIATPDVIYPESPILLLFSPELMRASLEPVFQYASSGHWYFPFAPAQLGTYPLANGQTYGGGETSEKDQQPVEESANMLIMTAALAKVGDASSITNKYWTVLSGWAEYVRKNGLDPDKQLCTDDFAGPMAHNANLSLKAIEALAAYSYLSGLRGDQKTASEYRDTAEAYASEWIKMAGDDDHTRLAFDQPDTWSQKYNLVWDRLLGFNLFPLEVARKEVAYYRQKSTPFGFPLDSRHSYTKLDWETWSASLTDSPSDFDALMEPVYHFVDRTPDLIPLTDWYDTTDGKAITWKDSSGMGREMGFHARPVLGAIFVRVLSDPLMWKKWSGQGAVSQPNAR
ncbi:MAG: DUF4965 domain-containing protein [Terracidiphilus sp.]